MTNASTNTDADANANVSVSVSVNVKTNSSPSPSIDVELIAKCERKAKIKQTLSELGRKITYYQALIAKTREIQKPLIAEHNYLDREIFEATHKTTIITKRKSTNMPEATLFGKKPRSRQKTHRPNYEKCSAAERQTILTRLLEIQAMQDAKHTGENSN